MQGCPPPSRPPKLSHGFALVSSRALRGLDRGPVVLFKPVRAVETNPHTRGLSILQNAGDHDGMAAVLALRAIAPSAIERPRFLGIVSIVSESECRMLERERGSQVTGPRDHSPGRTVVYRAKNARLPSLAPLAIAVSFTACGARTATGLSDTTSAPDAGSYAVDASPHALLLLQSMTTSESTTWEWEGSGSDWQPVADHGPPATLTSESVATLGKDMVLFGGYVCSLHQCRRMRQTWIWSGTAWTERVLPGPSARTDSSMATLNQREIVLFGGEFDGNTWFGDTWTWDGVRWTERSVPGPPPRADAAMAAFGDKIVLFGGFNGHSFLNDTWTWDGRAWRQAATGGPSARSCMGMAAAESALVMFGGRDDVTYGLSDTWTWDGAQWMQHETHGPGPRLSPAMTSLGLTAVLFGGEAANGASLDDTWTWAGDHWTHQSATIATNGYATAMGTVSSP